MSGMVADDLHWQVKAGQIILETVVRATIDRLC